MSSSQNCSEYFLDGITDVYLQSTDSFGNEVPFSVPQLLSARSSASLADSLFRISTSDNASSVYADSITAKTSVTDSGNGSYYTIEITASVTGNADELRSVGKKIGKNDYHVVLRTADGGNLLGYTLPNTFSFQSTTSITQTEETRTVSLSLKSMSDLVPLTINP